MDEQKEEISIPPQIQGTDRGRLVLCIEGLTWSVPQHPAACHVRIKWWGDNSEGAIIRIDEGDRRDVWTLSFPVRSGPKHVCRYLRDMGSLVARLEDATTSELVGQVLVDMRQLNVGSPLVGTLPICDDRNRCLGHLEVLMTLAFYDVVSSFELYEHLASLDAPCGRTSYADESRGSTARGRGGIRQSPNQDDQNDPKRQNYDHREAQRFDLFLLLEQVMKRKQWRLKELFDAYDKDGDGTLEEKELARLCQKVLPFDIWPVQISYFLVMMDADGDERISYREFSSAIRTCKEIVAQVRSSGAEMWRVLQPVARMLQQIKLEVNRVFQQHSLPGTNTVHLKTLPRMLKILLPTLTARELRFLIAKLYYDGFVSPEAHVTLDQLRTVLRLALNEPKPSPGKHSAEGEPNGGETPLSAPASQPEDSSGRSPAVRSFLAATCSGRPAAASCSMDSITFQQRARAAVDDDGWDRTGGSGASSAEPSAPRMLEQYIVRSPVTPRIPHRHSAADTHLRLAAKYGIAPVPPVAEMAASQQAPPTAGPHALSSPGRHASSCIGGAIVSRSLSSLPQQPHRPHPAVGRPFSRTAASNVAASLAALKSCRSRAHAQRLAEHGLDSSGGGDGGGAEQAGPTSAFASPSQPPAPPAQKHRPALAEPELEPMPLPPRQVAGGSCPAADAAAELPRAQEVPDALTSELVQELRQLAAPVWQAGRERQRPAASQHPLSALLESLSSASWQPRTADQMPLPPRLAMAPSLQQLQPPSLMGAAIIPPADTPARDQHSAPTGSASSGISDTKDAEITSHPVLAAESGEGEREGVLGPPISEPAEVTAPAEHRALPLPAPSSGAALPPQPASTPAMDSSSLTRPVQPPRPARSSPERVSPVCSAAGMPVPAWTNSDWLQQRAASAGVDVTQPAETRAAEESFSAPLHGSPDAPAAAALSSGAPSDQSSPPEQALPAAPKPSSFLQAGPAAPRAAVASSHKAPPEDAAQRLAWVLQKALNLQDALNHITSSEQRARQPLAPLPPFPGHAQPSADVSTSRGGGLSPAAMLQTAPIAQHMQPMALANAVYTPAAVFPTPAAAPSQSIPPQLQMPWQRSPPPPHSFAQAAGVAAAAALDFPMPDLHEDLEEDPQEFFERVLFRELFLSEQPLFSKPATSPHAPLPPALPAANALLPPPMADASAQPAPAPAAASSTPVPTQAAQAQPQPSNEPQGPQAVDAAVPVEPDPKLSPVPASTPTDDAGCDPGLLRPMQRPSTPPAEPQTLAALEVRLDEVLLTEDARSAAGKPGPKSSPAKYQQLLQRRDDHGADLVVVVKAPGVVGADDAHTIIRRQECSLVPRKWPFQLHKDLRLPSPLVLHVPLGRFNAALAGSLAGTHLIVEVWRLVSVSAAGPLSQQQLHSRQFIGAGRIPLPASISAPDAAAPPAGGCVLFDNTAAADHICLPLQDLLCNIDSGRLRVSVHLQLSDQPLTATTADPAAPSPATTTSPPAAADRTPPSAAPARPQQQLEVRPTEAEHSTADGRPDPPASLREEEPGPLPLEQEAHHFTITLEAVAGLPQRQAWAALGLQPPAGCFLKYTFPGEPQPFYTRTVPSGPAVLEFGATACHSIGLSRGEPLERHLAAAAAAPADMPEADERAAVEREWSRVGASMLQSPAPAPQLAFEVFHSWPARTEAEGGEAEVQLWGHAQLAMHDLLGLRQDLPCSAAGSPEPGDGHGPGESPRLSRLELPLAPSPLASPLWQDVSRPAVVLQIGYVVEHGQPAYQLPPPEGKTSPPAAAPPDPALQIGAADGEEAEEPPPSVRAVLRVDVLRAAGLLAAVEESQAWLGSASSLPSRVRQLGPNVFGLIHVLPASLAAAQAIPVVKTALQAQTFCPIFNYRQDIQLTLDEGVVAALASQQLCCELFHHQPNSLASTDALFRGASAAAARVERQAIFLGAGALSLDRLLVRPQGIDAWLPLRSRRGEPAGAVQLRLSFASLQGKPLHSCSLPQGHCLLSSFPHLQRWLPPCGRHLLGLLPPSCANPAAGQLRGQHVRASVLVQEVVVPAELCKEALPQEADFCLTYRLPGSSATFNSSTTRPVAKPGQARAEAGAPLRLRFNHTGVHWLVGDAQLHASFLAYPLVVQLRVAAQPAAGGNSSAAQRARATNRASGWRSGARGHARGRAHGLVAEAEVDVSQLLQVPTEQEAERSAAADNSASHAQTLCSTRVSGTFPLMSPTAKRLGHAYIELTVLLELNPASEPSPPAS